MPDSGKRKRSTCIVHVMTCKHCGTHAVSINDRRITSHKCAGAWNIVRTETIEVAEIHASLAQKALA